MDWRAVTASGSPRLDTVDCSRTGTHGGSGGPGRITDGLPDRGLPTVQSDDSCRFGRDHRGERTGRDHHEATALGITRRLLHDRRRAAHRARVAAPMRRHRQRATTTSTSSSTRRSTPSRTTATPTATRSISHRGSRSRLRRRHRSSATRWSPGLRSASSVWWTRPRARGHRLVDLHDHRRGRHRHGDGHDRERRLHEHPTHGDRRRPLARGGHHRHLLRRQPTTSTTIPPSNSSSRRSPRQPATRSRAARRRHHRTQSAATPRLPAAAAPPTPSPTPSRTPPAPPSSAQVAVTITAAAISQTVVTVTKVVTNPGVTRDFDRSEVGVSRSSASVVRLGTILPRVGRDVAGRGLHPGHPALRPRERRRRLRRRRGPAPGRTPARSPSTDRTLIFRPESGRRRASPARSPTRFRPRPASRSSRTRSAEPVPNLRLLHHRARVWCASRCRDGESQVIDLPFDGTVTVTETQDRTRFFLSVRCEDDNTGAGLPRRGHQHPDRRRRGPPVGRAVRSPARSPTRCGRR